MKKKNIKYRTWSKQAQCMIPWKDLKSKFVKLLNHPEYPYMQFTGLLDKQGKEIYSGDIILCDNKTGEVKYDEQQGAYIILWQPNNKKQKSGCDNLASTFPSPLKEVIGNIYEQGGLNEKN